MVPGAAPLQEKALARFKAQGAWLDTGQGQQTESHHVQPSRCCAQEPRVIHPDHQHPSPWWQTAPRPRWANPSPACNSWMLHSRYCSGNPALSASGFLPTGCPICPSPSSLPRWLCHRAGGPRAAPGPSHGTAAPASRNDQMWDAQAAGREREQT